jgi:hypothetical protein
MFFHSAGLAEGGKDNGAPGERRCHPGYYACFLLDPDGIQAVFHGEAKRSGFLKAYRRQKGLASSSRTSSIVRPMSPIR